MAERSARRPGMSMAERSARRPGMSATRVSGGGPKYRGAVL